MDDSLDLVELVMELERATGIDFPDDALAALRRDSTARDLWRIVVRARTGVAPAGRPAAGDPMWGVVRAFLAAMTARPADDVTPETPLFEAP